MSKSKKIEPPQRKIVLLGDLVCETDESGTFDPSLIFDTPLNRQRSELRRKHRDQIRRQKRDRFGDGLTIVEAAEQEHKLLTQQQREVVQLYSTSTTSDGKQQSTTAGGQGPVSSLKKPKDGSRGVLSTNIATTVGLVPVSSHGFMQPLPLEYTGATKQDESSTARQRDRSVSLTNSLQQQPAEVKSMLGEGGGSARCVINVSALPRDRPTSAPKLLVMNPSDQCHHLTQTDMVNHLDRYWSPVTLFQQEYGRCFLGKGGIRKHKNMQKNDQQKKLAAENGDDDDESSTDESLKQQLRTLMKDVDEEEEEEAKGKGKSALKKKGPVKRETEKQKTAWDTAKMKHGAVSNDISKLWDALTPNQRKYYQLRVEQKFQCQRGGV